MITTHFNRYLFVYSSVTLISDVFFLQTVYVEKVNGTKITSLFRAKALMSRPAAANTNILSAAT